MENESLSKTSCKSNSSGPVSAEAIPNAFKGEYAELILKSMIHGFHSTSLIVTTPDGTILLANRIAAIGFPDSTAETVIGKNFCDLAPREWALERIEFMKLAIERGRPLMVAEVLDGTRLCSTVSPIEITGKKESSWILLITVEQITPMKLAWLRKTKDQEELVDAKFIDLGPLACLSPRELEVLALMGHGLRQKQIAEKLHRSVSTIDRHRERIGEKLGVTDRIELVALAREAALEVVDATRTNTPFGHPIGFPYPNPNAE